MTADTAKFNPGTRETISCQRCGGVSIATLQTLRVMGWRIWSGTTTTGVPHEVRICPTCFDSVPAQPGGERGGWDAECDTCGATMSEEEDDGGGGEPFTKRDAERWRSLHECEPSVHVIEPKAADRAPVAPLSRPVETTRSL